MDTRKPNIIIILTDCLRWDYFIQMSISKEFDLTFRNTYSIAPSTFFSIPSLLTGTLPFELSNKAIIPRGLPFYLPTLLTKEGYLTIFITGNIVTSRFFGYKQGEHILFEDFISRKPTDIRALKSTSKEGAKKKIKEVLIKKAPFLYHTISDTLKYLRYWSFKLGVHKQFTDQNVNFDSKIRAYEIIDTFESMLPANPNSPIFAFLHFMDTHTPYGPPDEPINKLKSLETLIAKLYTNPQNITEEEKATVIEMYQKEVAFLDQQLKKLLDFIWEKLGRKNTLVILISDHGELLGEDGKYLHPDNVLNEFTLHVPLAVAGLNSKNKLEKFESNLVSSLSVYYLITNLLFNGKYYIPELSETISVGYTKNIERIYSPYNIFIKRGKSFEKVYVLEETPELKIKFENLLVSRRRRTLLLKLNKINLYKYATEPRSITLNTI